MLACIDASVSKQADELQKRTLAAYETTGDTLIRLDMQSYQELLLHKAKKYHLFVVYTANLQMCRICKPFVDALEHVALSYLKVC